MCELKGMNVAVLLTERRAESQHHLQVATSHVSPGNIATELHHQARILRDYKRDGDFGTAKYDREHLHVGDHDHHCLGEDAEQEARRLGVQGGQRALQELPDVHHPRPRVGAPPYISGDRTAPGQADGEGHRPSPPRV